MREREGMREGRRGWREDIITNGGKVVACQQTEK